MPGMFPVPRLFANAETEVAGRDGVDPKLKPEVQE